MNFERGSEWAKWDLHVHSPASFNWNSAKRLANLDTAEKEAVIREWIAAMNASDVAVFSVMDYWTFDGYIALREYLAHHPGELKKTVFPGIELRVQAPTSERLDIHAILSDELSTQYLRDFQSKLHLQIIDGTQRPLHAESLREYARSLHDDQLKGRSRDVLMADDDAAWMAGCETCEVTLESFRAAVNSLDKDKAVIFQPWDTYHGLSEAKWQNHYTSTHQLFAQPDIFECKGAAYRAAFVGQRTPENDKFFDSFWTALGQRPRLAVRGSDAHKFADYGKFQSNLTTWIKAAPTFKGLLQAIKEPQLRSWLGDIPPKMQIRTDKPSIFIDEVRIRKTADSKLANEIWFDGQTLKLNSDLVAVIGSKGSGKSALADILALLADTANPQMFSFLTSARFRDRKNNRSQHFEGELLWANGTSNTKRLSENPEEGTLERARYVPQRYFDEVCSGETEKDIQEFTTQIENVIYAYVPAELRGDSQDLQELLSRQEAEGNVNLLRLRTEIRKLNQEIIEIGRRSSADFIGQLEAELKLTEQQLADLEAAKPDEPQAQTEEELQSASEDSNVLKIAEGELARDRLVKKLVEGAQEIKHLQARMSAGERLSTGLKNLKRLVTEETERLQPDATSLGVNLSGIVTFEIKSAAVADRFQEVSDQLTAARERIEGGNEQSLSSQLFAVEKSIAETRSALSAKQLERQAAKERFAVWQQQVNALKGGAELPTSIEHIKSQIEYAKTGNERIAQAATHRAAKTEEIAAELLSIRQAREDLIEKARATIEAVVPKHPTFSLGFVNELALSSGFEESFFDHVKLVSGTFRGEDEGRRAFREFVESQPLTTADELLGIAAGLERMLLEEKKAGDIVKHDLESLLRRGKTPEDLLNFLYGLDYVQPRFSLAQAGQPLAQLSPGQRGALLLIFFLLVEQSDLPIILDQPEENLDNETVYSLLVPAIKLAKEKRQIIMVTHNANLAVCCDAEQILHAVSTKADHNRITYHSGPLEHSEINKAVVDVLEGTRPAFNRRSSTYHG